MALDLAIGVISRWSSTSANNSYVFSSQRDQIDQYLHAVDQIQCSIVSGTTYDLSMAKPAIQIAMLRLADEMDNLLKINARCSTTHDNPDSSTYSSTMTDSGSNSYVDDYEYCVSVSDSVIDDLRSIAQRMNGSGYVGDCKKAYISNRKRCIGASYQRLDIQKLSSNDARTMEWNTLESIIKVWMKSAKICFRKIFSYEKQLCAKILGDDDCFLEISNDCASQLLEIATNLSGIKTAAGRLFGILELYKTCSDLVPEINKLFNTTRSSESFRTKADQMVRKLAGAACLIIEKFEKDLITACMTSDKIHSLCKYVMEYVYKLEQNKQTLMELLLSNPPAGAVSCCCFREPQLQNKFPFHVMWIIMCLVSKLEGEVQLYQNDSNIHFCVMNNFFYIVQKINAKPEVKEMIREDCFKNMSSKFDQVKAKYLRLILTQVLSILARDKMPLKKRLTRFNAEFNNVQINLEKHKIPDFQLLMDIRESLEEMLVAPYSSLLKLVSSSHCSSADVRFSVEELKTAIQGLFPSA